jgi:hypothetical protein
MFKTRRRVAALEEEVASLIKVVQELQKRSAPPKVLRSKAKQQQIDEAVATEHVRELYRKAELD